MARLLFFVPFASFERSFSKGRTKLEQVEEAAKAGE